MFASNPYLIMLAFFSHATPVGVPNEWVLKKSKITREKTPQPPRPHKKSHSKFNAAKIGRQKQAEKIVCPFAPAAVSL